MAIEAAAPEMMRCDRRNMTLTTPGCIRLWKSAQESRPAEHEGRYECLTCPIGAANAGVTISPVADLVEALRTICPRCRRRSARMIAGRLCVSCYNRDREVVIGKNCKGHRPLLADVLHGERLAIIGGGNVEVGEFAAVTSSIEVMVAAARSASG